MARDSRAERRARREARERSGGGGSDGGQATTRPALQPATSHAGSRSDQNWARRFVGESVSELKKVEWPSQNHLIQGTVVVIVACVVMGSYLYLVDQIFSKFVSKVLLGQ
jgi:preprotein translocase SecE subunit